MARMGLVIYDELCYICLHQNKNIMKKQIMLVLAIGCITLASCGKKCVTCKEKTYMYGTNDDLQNGSHGDGSGDHRMCEGETVLNQDGTSEKRTQAQIDQLVREYEASGIYECD